MLDIKLIKNKKDEIEQALRKRMPECSLDNIVEMDNQRLELQRKLDDLLSFRNKKSKEIAIKKREGKDVAETYIHTQLQESGTSGTCLLSETEYFFRAKRNGKDELAGCCLFPLFL